MPKIVLTRKVYVLCSLTPLTKEYIKQIKIVHVHASCIATSAQTRVTVRSGTALNGKLPVCRIFFLYQNNIWVFGIRYSEASVFWEHNRMEQTEKSFLLFYEYSHWTYSKANYFKNYTLFIFMWLIGPFFTAGRPKTAKIFWMNQAQRTLYTEH